MSKFIRNSVLLTAILIMFQFCSSTKTFDNRAAAEYFITVTQGGVELGEIGMKLFKDEAPEHSRNFDSLVSIGFYDGTLFHRVMPKFMIQGGDPRSKEPRSQTNIWGYGLPGQKKINAEFSETMSHTRGIISAARSNDPNSATSQFFICVDDASRLDGKYSIFGEVVSGMDVADKIVNTKIDGSDDALTRPKVNIEMKIKKVNK
ncbi:MAG: peptidylprolyl isomerase [Candidatus Kapabacteria bacterium]|nr:peptidylprolyl isomerase [Candidatus Kapabacteria bacterium]